MKNLKSTIFILLLLFVLTGCSKSKTETIQDVSVNSASENKILNTDQVADKLEVYYFQHL